MEISLVALSVLVLASPLIAEDELVGGELRAHEWGTFTTLHWSNGNGLGWYQRSPQIGYDLNARAASAVSDLPSFVQGGGFGKAALDRTARMETPVIYRQQGLGALVKVETADVAEARAGK